MILSASISTPMETIFTPDLKNISDDLKGEVALCRKLQRAIKGQPIVVVINALGRSLFEAQNFMRSQTAQNAPKPAGGPAGIVNGDISDQS